MKKHRDEILLDEIAQRVKQLRAQRGISQADFLIATDINIARIECAEVNVSITTLKRICDFFETSLSDFFKDLPFSKIDSDE